MEHHKPWSVRRLHALDDAHIDALALYARMGWVRLGTIPGYALMPRGGLCSTTFFYRDLHRETGGAGAPNAAGAGRVVLREAGR